MYIYKLYPYRLTNLNIIKAIKTFSLLRYNIKALKKFVFFHAAKLYFNKREYTMFLEANKINLDFSLNRLQLIDYPFAKRHLFIDKYNERLNFWFFFDYYKVNKYFQIKYKNIYKKELNINLFFLKRTRKEYIKLRNNILRMISLYFYYINLERVHYKHYWPDISPYDINNQIQTDYDSLKLNWYLNTYLTNERRILIFLIIHIY